MDDKPELDFKELINEIKDLPDNDEKWDNIGEFLTKAGAEIYKTSDKKYEKYYLDLYKKFFGEYFNYNLAEYAIKSMHHDDKDPMVFDYEQSVNLAEKYELKINDKQKYNYWYCINMMSMDYGNMEFEENVIAKLAYDFIIDEDSGAGVAKTFRYFYYIALGLE